MIYVQRCFYKTRGFTIIEILLSLVIFSVIMGSLFSVWRLGVYIQRRSEARVGVVKETAAFFEALGRDLENARAYNFSSSYPQLNSFDGKEQEILFLTVRNGRLVMVRYGLVQPAAQVAAQADVEDIRHIARFEAPLEKYMESSKELADPVRVFRIPLQTAGFAFNYSADAPSAQDAGIWKKDSPPPSVCVRCTIARPGEPAWVVQKILLVPAISGGV